ncbi:response regulator [Mesorhizobium sp. BAC0120]|uniref:response regulator n=1 Tax=Mesorhizobium sp. BAC0120 TaxID=3090670 RepID=UPI00298C7BFD|nr:response regulator [Mesorhizobium sp. BAC0120]MDW6025120.1 response regulator [Mesorhizobium sp. BAC0120]
MVADKGEDAATENLSAVLVVGTSQITRVVVSKIVERCGLRPVAESPETAGRVLSALKPGTVILDGGADNCDCDHLFDSLSVQRRISGRNVPRVILLSIRTVGSDDLRHASVIDAVVAKPITPETLQPVVSRLVEAVRA